MTEVLRLIGLSQDGSLMTLVMVGVGVWVIMSVKQLRADHGRMEARMDRLETRMDRLEAAINKIAADVAFLRGKAEQNG